MKRSKFSEQQIVFILRQAEEGTRVEEVCRKAGMAAAIVDRFAPDQSRRVRSSDSRAGGHRRLTVLGVAFVSAAGVPFSNAEPFATQRMPQGFLRSAVSSDVVGVSGGGVAWPGVAWRGGGMCGDYNALSRGGAARHGWEIMLGAERKACLGMRQLEKAVLEVLFEAQRNGEWPGVAEISRRAGLFGGKGDAGRAVAGCFSASFIAVRRPSGPSAFSIIRGSYGDFRRPSPSSRS